MSEARTLLEQAARCRRIARVCTTASVARKFEALAKDYEEHARLVGEAKRANSILTSIEIYEPRTAECAPGDSAGAIPRRTTAAG